MKKLRIVKQQELETKIKQLERKHKLNRRGDMLNKLKGVRQQLDELLTYKAEGAFRYSSRNYYEMGNKASRLLAFQLRKAQFGCTVRKIKHPETNLVETQPKEVSEAFANFYKLLFKGQEQDSKKEKNLKFLRPLNMEKLSTDEATKLIQPITEDKIRDTISR